MEGSYETLKITRKSPESRVFHLLLDRPSRGNALSRNFFTEFPAALRELDENSEVGVVILSGNGNHFCTGIDLQTLNSISDENRGADSGRAADKLQKEIKFLQRAVTAIEECRKPVIASIHGACIGGGVDIITACDMRYSTENAFFSVKAVDLGITADLGTLQRLPAIVGLGNAMELALTARTFSGSEAQDLGLVTRVFRDKEALERGVYEIAEGIAARSPLAVIGTKRVILRSRDLTLDQGLDYVAVWNSGRLLSDDITEAMSAQLQKRKPLYAKL